MAELGSCSLNSLTGAYMPTSHLVARHISTTRSNQSFSHRLLSRELPFLCFVKNRDTSCCCWKSVRSLQRTRDKINLFSIDLPQKVRQDQRQYIARAALSQSIDKKETDGVVRELAFLALPALIAQAIEPLVQLVDTAYIGRIGAVELAAVGVSISAFNMVSKAFNIPLLNMTTSFVAEEVSLSKSSREFVSSQAVGATDVTAENGSALSTERGTNACSGKLALPAVSSALIIAASVGVLEALILGVGTRFVLKVMGVTQASVMQAPAVRFLSLRAIGAPAAVISLAVQGVFRGLKDTSTPLYATAIGSFVNMLLDPILIFVFQFGITGAAIATICSQYLIMVLLLWRLNERVLLLSPDFHSLQLTKFLKSGGLLMSRTLSVVTLFTLSASMAARLGAVSMAAHQIASQTWLAVSLLSDSLALAVQAIIASAVAKKEYGRIKSVTARVLQLSMALGLLMALGLAFCKGIPRLFTNDPQVLQAVARIMPFVIITQPINALAFVFDGIYYGASDFSYAAYSAIVAGIASSAFLYLQPHNWGMSGVWLGLTAFMSLRMSAGFFRLGTATGPWSFLRTNFISSAAED